MPKGLLYNPPHQRAHLLFGPKSRPIPISKCNSQFHNRSPYHPDGWSSVSSPSNKTLAIYSTKSPQTRHKTASQLRPNPNSASARLSMMSQLLPVRSRPWQSSASFRSSRILRFLAPSRLDWMVVFVIQVVLTLRRIRLLGWCGSGSAGEDAIFDLKNWKLKDESKNELLW